MQNANSPCVNNFPLSYSYSHPGNTILSCSADHSDLLSASGHKDLAVPNYANPTHHSDFLFSLLCLLNLPNVTKENDTRGHYKLMLFSLFGK